MSAGVDLQEAAYHTIRYVAFFAASWKQMR